MRESKIEKQIKDYAQSLGWHYLKFTSPSKRGVPDRLLFKCGIVMFMELKKEGKPLNPQQLKRLKELNEEKIPAFVIDNVEKGKFILDRYEKMIELQFE